MCRSRFNEEQIIGILKEHPAGRGMMAWRASPLCLPVNPRVTLKTVLALFLPRVLNGME